jgi:NADH:ubiquinone oxidoreductase subunit 6 (subunit J)
MMCASLLLSWSSAALHAQDEPADATAVDAGSPDAASTEDVNAGIADEPTVADPDEAAAAASITAVPEVAPAMVPAGSLMEAVVFYVVGGVAAATALGCVLSVNIVRMATFLFGTLGSVAILYFLMAANFLGAIQLIVYAGGTLIVIIFGVMLTSKSPWVNYVPRPAELIAGAVVCLALFGGLTAMVLRTPWEQPKVTGESYYEVAQIGWSLLTTYLVPFELASVLLLAVMIGAAYLARTERAE